MNNWKQNLDSALFAPLQPSLTQLDVQHFPTLTQLNQLSVKQKVCNSIGLPLRFVEQQYGKLPFEQQYEPRCYLSGEVPTRTENWHDLFNALVWIHFPYSKAVINQRHYQALTQAQPQSTSQRGRVRDVNTLFDESGVVIVSDRSDLLELLQTFQWQELFWHQRLAVQKHMQFFVFGHAIYEKSVNPYIGMTAHGILLHVQTDFFNLTKLQQQTQVDKLLADNLSNVQRNTRDLAPLPILGVPGWYKNNEQLAFYQNANYFRSCRRNKN